jgi:hypothetical protein
MFAAAPVKTPPTPPACLTDVRLIELSAQTAAGRFSLAVEWLLAAQRGGDPAAWIQPAGGRLYPPDLLRNGVDLASLLVVQVPPREARLGALRAAEIVLRSGSFAVVVIDLLDGVPPHDAAWQGRLLRLMRRHRTTVLVLTHKAAAHDSIGPMCGLRLQPRRQRGTAADDGFWIDTTTLKNKASQGWLPAPALCRGPPGLL